MVFSLLCYAAVTRAVGKEFQMVGKDFYESFKLLKYNERNPKIRLLGLAGFA